MNNITYSYVWNYRNNKLKTDEPASVHLKVYFDRQNRRFVETGVEIPEEYWDAAKAYVKRRHPNYTRLHAKLKETRDRIESYEELLTKQKRILTPAELDAFLSGQKSDPSSFLEFFRREMDNDNTLKEGSKKPHSTTLDNLTDYSSGRLSFEDLTYRWAVEFDRWLRDKKLSPNTIQKRHKIVSRYYRIAERYKLVERGSNPYNDFKVRGVEGSREAIAEEQLLALETLDRTVMDANTQIVLDRFLFSCYTGLRVSDNISLLKSEIYTEEDGLVVVKKMEKTDTVTGKSVTLPLRLLFGGKPEQIARRYMKKYPAVDTLFPAMEPQPINRLLKVISIVAKMRTPLTFHMSRHTFGTALADITMNPYLIMDLMGHSDIKTSMIYIHRSAERTKRHLAGIAKTKWWGK